MNEATLSQVQVFPEGDAVHRPEFMVLLLPSYYVKLGSNPHTASAAFPQSFL